MNTIGEKQGLKMTIGKINFAMILREKEIIDITKAQ